MSAIGFCMAIISFKPNCHISLCMVRRMGFNCYYLVLTGAGTSHTKAPSALGCCRIWFVIKSKFNWSRCKFSQVRTEFRPRSDFPQPPVMATSSKTGTSPCHLATSGLNLSWFPLPVCVNTSYEVTVGSIHYVFLCRHTFSDFSPDRKCWDGCGTASFRAGFQPEWWEDSFITEFSQS